jgi:Fur family transcriptional regulator, ferric uptake regulator
MIITKARSKIMGIFSESTKPLSALDLLRKVKVNKTTIYRELDYLEDVGVLGKVDFGDRIRRYELKSLDHHHHLVCLKCKSVANINMNENFELPKDFKVVRHNLEFFGFCPNCQ